MKKAFFNPVLSSIHEILKKSSDSSGDSDQNN